MVSSLRSRRSIWGADNRALIVALDHLPLGGFMDGWEQPASTLRSILNGRPDAIMTTFGILKHFSHLFEAHTVARILRVDGGHTYLVDEWPRCSAWHQWHSIEDAIAVGADAVIASIFIGAEVEAASLACAAQLAGACLRHQMPFIVEALPVGGTHIEHELDPELVSYAARLAAELGADCVKTYYTGDQRSFHRVVERCPCPVLMAGGPLIEEESRLLEVAQNMMEAGGKGMFVGRNVWQRSHPEEVLESLSRVIHSRPGHENGLPIKGSPSA